MTYEQKQCILKFFRCYDGDIDGLWGPASSEGTKKLQKALELKDDGIFGRATEAAVRQRIGEGHSALPEEKASQEAPVDVLEDWWEEIRYFSPEEFMCQCRKYTKYCDGWPHRMQEQVVRICDRVREHFGQPVTIISGLRCPQHNAAPYVKGVVNSQHMYGEAADIYVWGISAVTVCAWLNAQSDVRYAYVIPGSNNVHFDIEKQNR